MTSPFVEAVKQVAEMSDAIKIWKGICLDDGTGQNVYFIANDGTQSRNQPLGFSFDLFSNGDRRFFYRVY